jgi:fructose-1,6-bisphosphatase II
MANVILGSANGQPGIAETVSAPRSKMAKRAHDPERLFDLDLVRCTENGALAAWKWIGKGNKNAADFDASDAIRGMFNLIDCQGIVRIGEGIKDEAPGIFMGEKLGSWKPGSPAVAIAVDPIDGTTPLAKGLNGSISVLAVATCDDPSQDPRDLFPNVPSHYMQKLAVGPRVASSGSAVQLDAPLEQNLKIIADALGKRVSDLVAVVLDRPRHSEIIRSLRAADCGIRLIPDGDVAAAIAPCLPDSGVDLYLGMGGSPEAVLASAAIKCLGGQLLSRMAPKDDNERQSLIEDHGCQPEDITKIWTVSEMAKGEHIIFVATGISDSPMLRGIRYEEHSCTTDSLLIRARHRTLRRIEAHHDVAHKTIRLASSGGEAAL